jgi:hypothetical protein
MEEDSVPSGVGLPLCEALCVMGGEGDPDPLPLNVPEGVGEGVGDLL